MKLLDLLLFAKWSALGQPANKNVHLLKDCSATLVKVFSSDLALGLPLI
jgi:hypothetical protein